MAVTIGFLQILFWHKFKLTKIWQKGILKMD